jgi:hypothetical protein
MNKQRVAFTALAALVTVSLFWLGGVDFDKRGFLQAYALVVALMVGGFAWACPCWWEEKK